MPLPDGVCNPVWTVYCYFEVVWNVKVGLQPPTCSGKHLKNVGQNKRSVSGRKLIEIHKPSPETLRLFQPTNHLH
jgi:hypothetical protein